MFNEICYKFLQDGLTEISTNGTISWKIGEDKEAIGEIVGGVNGLYSYQLPFDALSHSKGQIIAVVEIGEKYSTNNSCISAGRMRLLHAYRWTARDSVLLAVTAAEYTLSLFEHCHPEDSSPRQDLEVALQYLSGEPLLNKKPVYTVLPDYTSYDSYGSARAAALYTAECARYAERNDWRNASLYATAVVSFAATALGDVTAIHSRINQWMMNTISSLEEIS